MILTRESIHAGKSDRGGWTRRQVELLGVRWPLGKGWLVAIVGRQIPDRAYEQFLLLKNIKNLNMLKKRHPGSVADHPELFHVKTPEDEINAIYLANRSEFE